MLHLFLRTLLAHFRGRAHLPMPESEQSAVMGGNGGDGGGGGGVVTVASEQMLWSEGHR